MRDLFILLVHALVTLMRALRPGGVRAVVAESVLAKHQLLILNRSRRRAPNLRILDRLVAGLCSLWIRPRMLRRVTIVFKPSRFLGFHRAMVQCKYRLLFSPKTETETRPEGSNRGVDPRSRRNERALSGRYKSTSTIKCYMAEWCLRTQMPSRDLSIHPSLEQYKKQVKEPLKACRSGDSEALKRIREHSGRFSHKSAGVSVRSFKLSDAQFDSSKVAKRFMHWEEIAYIDTPAFSAHYRFWRCRG